MNTAKKLIHLLSPQDRTRFYLLLVPMTASSLLEFLSLGLVVPLLYALSGSDMSGVGDGGIMHDILAYLASIEGANTWIISCFAGILVVKNLIIILSTYLVNRVTRLSLANFISVLYDQYLAIPFIHHMNLNRADIVRNLTRSIDNSFLALQQAMVIALELSLAIAALGLLLLLHPYITLGLAAFMGILGLCIYVIAAPSLRRWGRRAHDLDAAVLKDILQGLGSIRDVKILGVRQQFVRQLSRMLVERALTVSNANTLHQAPRYIVEVAMALALLVLILSLRASGSSFEDTIGIVALFGMASLRLIPSLNKILSGCATIRHLSPAVDHIYEEYCNMTRQLVADSPRVAPLPTKCRCTLFKHEITFDDICFRYDESGPLVLDRIDLKIPRGDDVGIVGMSGSGKTTLSDVFMGLLAPSSGRTLVDGNPVDLASSDWQRLIGFVPQDIYLSDESLRRNIAFGIPDAQINDARVWEAAQQAQLTSVIEMMPEGLATSIGEEGIRLSGGQRQRVGIARALYRDPDILVLDEATSALDSETESAISGTIRALAQTKTVLIIAHRLSTIQHCSRIIFMAQGRIVDSGTFQELNERNGEFRRLVELGDLQ